MEQRFLKVNYWEVLELPSTASPADIKAAFRRLALIHHPDKATYDKAKAKERFQEIAEAYEVLSDTNIKKRYIEVRTNRRDYDDFDEYDYSGASSTCNARRPGNMRPRPRGATMRSEGTAHQSIAAERRARVKAELQREADQRDRDWAGFLDQQKKEQELYEDLKAQVRARMPSTSSMGSPSISDEQWQGWWQDRVNKKWLNSTLDNLLKTNLIDGVEISDDLRNVVLKDAAREEAAATLIRRGSTSTCAGELRAIGGDESLPTRQAESGYPRPKQRASTLSRDEKLQQLRREEPQRPSQGGAPLPAAAQAFLDKQQGKHSKPLVYFDLIGKLNSLGFSANDSERVARSGPLTVEEAIMRIRAQR